MLYQSIFTELYRKVRKLTVDQKLSPGTISTVWTQTFLFWALITPRGVTEMLFYSLLFIGWWITWYSQNVFWLHNAILTYFEIIEYLVSYVLHFKGLTPRISKIYISWKSNDPTGSCHIFSISVVKMTNFDPRTRNCHVIHQIEANEPGIIIKLILTENFYPESKYIR